MNSGLLSPLLSLSPLSSRAPSRVSTPVPTRPSSPLLSLPIPTTEFPPRSVNNPNPTVESQGFVLYLLSGLLYGMYLVWSLCPEELLSKLGIDWYPSRFVTFSCTPSDTDSYSVVNGQF